MIAVMAALLMSVTSAEILAAQADRAQYAVPHDYGYVFYLSTSHLSGEAKIKTENAIKFSSATSSRQQIIEKCVPVEVADGLYRIDLRDMKWDWRLWHKVVAKYPYAYGLQSVYRADWLHVQLSDTTGSNAHYLLLYGRDDFNRNDFLKFWQVNNDITTHFGVICRSNDPSGPAVTGLRLVECRPTSLWGSAWGTRDSAVINKKSDPSENLQNNFQHDAEEWLIANPKQSTTTGKRGSLLAAWLNDAKGKRQEEAPPNIVTDHHGFRGQRAIRNWGSCVSCHAQGINDPGISELRTFIERGVLVDAKPKKVQEQIELYHLSDASKQIARDNEDFAAGVEMCNGLTGLENAEAFNAAIDLYDAELTLETAAAELHTDAKELRLALAYASNAGVNLGFRLSSLPHGGTITRAAWEQHGYYDAYRALSNWRTAK
jgi:hypothetical protein